MSSQKKKELKNLIDKGRVFNEKWTDEYFFVKTNNMVLCLICKKIMSVFKDYNLKRHCIQKHAAKFDAYKGMFHEDKIVELRESRFSYGFHLCIQVCAFFVCYQNPQITTIP